MNKLDKIDYLTIIIPGIILGIIGIYLTAEFSAERYEEFGILFPVWLFLQSPVYFVALLFGISASVTNLLTFFWWFLLGGGLGFIIVSLINYFSSIHVE